MTTPRSRQRRISAHQRRLVRGAPSRYDPNRTVPTSYPYPRRCSMRPRGPRSVALAGLLVAILGVGGYFGVREFSGESALAAARRAMDRRDFPEASRLLDNQLASHPTDA